MGPWLAVVGCLPDGELAPHAPPTVLFADAVFGAERLLTAAGIAAEARRPWPQPLSGGIAALLARRPRATTVLASGDPLHHGIAGTLLRTLPAEEIAVYPAPSAFSLAAAAMRWPIEEVACVSLHDRPAGDVRRFLRGARRLLVLTRDGEAPAAIAGELSAAGLAESRLTVLERLPRGRRIEAVAGELRGSFDALNTLAVELPDTGPLAADALAHDGCITRDEVRAVTVSALGSGRGHLWDVGAGSGAVAIDWCRAGGSATLFERVPDRLRMIEHNLAATGTPARLIEGDAPGSFASARPPDAIFLGGSVTDDTLFDAAWARLRSGGRLVSNAVTMEGESATHRRFARLGGTLTRIAIASASPLGRFTAMRPALPVLQWRVTRG